MLADLGAEAVALSGWYELAPVPQSAREFQNRGRLAQTRAGSQRTVNTKLQGANFWRPQAGFPQEAASPSTLGGPMVQGPSLAGGGLD